MSIFYRITDANQNTHYLFGTLHSGDKRVNSLSPEVIKAMQQVDTVAMESDIETSPDKMCSKIFDILMTYKNSLGNTSIFSALETRDPETYHKILSHYVDSLKNANWFSWFFSSRSSLEIRARNELDLFTPPMISTLITFNFLNAKYGQHPLDHSIYKFAKNERKQQIFLENYDVALEKMVAVQLNLEQQIAFAQHWFKKSDYKILSEDLEKLQEQYLNEDIEKIRDTSNYSEAEILFSKGLFEARDENFTNNFIKHIHENPNESVFIAVGAGHLPGMIENLKEKELIVEAIPLSERSIYLDSEGHLHDISEKPWYQRLFDWILSYFKTSKLSDDHSASSKAMNDNANSYQTAMAGLADSPSSASDLSSPVHRQSGTQLFQPLPESGSISTESKKRATTDTSCRQTAGYC